MSKKVLVIGGAGLLGASLVNQLMENSFFSEIAVGDIIDPHFEGVVYEKLDLLDEAGVSSIIRRFDIIINCAGQVTRPIHLCLELNTKGIANLVRALEGTNKKLYHVSTVAVYGSTSFADEATAFNPETPYATCKAFAEFQVTSALNENNYCVLRLSNLYGEKQEKGVFNYLLKSFQSDRALDFNNNGQLVRYFLHVDDCAKIIVQALKAELSGIYNLVGPDKFTVLELIGLVEDIGKMKFSVKLDPAEPYDNIVELSDMKLELKLKPIYANSVRNYFQQRLARV